MSNTCSHDRIRTKQRFERAERPAPDKRPHSSQFAQSPAALGPLQLTSLRQISDKTAVQPCSQSHKSRRFLPAEKVRREFHALLAKSPAASVFRA
jgi:hypothetical protein